MRLRCGAGYPRNKPLRFGIPIWCAKPRKRGDDVNPARILHGSRKGFAFGRMAEKSQVIPEPLHRAARIENAPLESVRNFAAYAVTYRRNKSVFRNNSLFTRVIQHEKPCSVSYFTIADIEAALSDKRRLLIPRDSANGNFNPVILEFSNRLVRHDNFRQRVFRNSEDIQKLVIPFAGVNIEKHRSGRVGNVGYKCFPAREFVTKKTVDRSEAKLARGGFFPYRGDVIHKPFHLACRKIRV